MKCLNFTVSDCFFVQSNRIKFNRKFHRVTLVTLFFQFNFILRNHSVVFIRAFHDFVTWPCKFFTSIAFFRVISLFGTFLNNLVIYLVKALVTTDFLKINKTKRLKGKYFVKLIFVQEVFPSEYQTYPWTFINSRPKHTVFRVTRKGFKWHTGGKNETLFPPNSTLALAFLHHF